MNRVQLVNQYGYTSEVIVVVWYKHVIGFVTKTYYVKSSMSIVSILIKFEVKFEPSSSTILQHHCKFDKFYLLNLYIIDANVINVTKSMTTTKFI